MNLEPLTFGQLLRTLRVRRNLGLRAFCEHADYNASNVSRYERGRLPPPGPAVVDKFADALGLDAEDRQRLQDLAAAGRGRVPRDLTDAELLKKLPAIWCGVRRALSEGRLDGFIKRLGNV